MRGSFDSGGASEVTRSFDNSGASVIPFISSSSITSYISIHIASHTRIDLSTVIQSIAHHGRLNNGSIPRRFHKSTRFRTHRLLSTTLFLKRFILFQLKHLRQTSIPRLFLRIPIKLHLKFKQLSHILQLFSHSVQSSIRCT